MSNVVRQSNAQLPSPVSDTAGSGLRSDVAVVPFAGNASADAPIAPQSSYEVAPVPGFFLGAVPSVTFVVPFRHVGWSFTVKSVNEHSMQIDPRSNDGLKNLLTRFGLVYWKSLAVEIELGLNAPHIFAAGRTLWTHARAEDKPGLSTTLINSHPYSQWVRLSPGSIVRLDCPFDGYVSALVSSAPLIGSRAVFGATLDIGSSVPPSAHMVETQVQGSKPSQALEWSVYRPDDSVKCFHIRLVGELVVGMPLPALF